MDGSRGTSDDSATPFDEREGEEDAELEIEALHAHSIVTADRFVKYE